MKKILFRKILIDCISFFLITLISTSVIIWVFQAVNFLDIIVEDGRDFWVYFNYTLLNFPKIISKIVPFAVFFSFCYIVNRYELNNELIIFWNFGVHKIELINFFFKFSIILFILQILLSAFIVPFSQNYSRSIIRNSSVDFFESFVKPKKFNDNIKGLTIFAEDKKKNGELTIIAPIITNINDGSHCPNKSKKPKTLAGFVMLDTVNPKPKIIPLVNEIILLILTYSKK